MEEWSFILKTLRCVKWKCECVTAAESHMWHRFKSATIFGFAFFLVIDIKQMETLEFFYNINDDIEHPIWEKEGK